MSLFPKQPDLIGIDYGASSVKIAALKKQRKGWNVIHLKEMPVKSRLDEAIPKNAIVSTAIGPGQVLTRSFQMQLKRESDIRSALDFQAESLLPFPTSEAIVEAQIVGKNEKGTSLTLCAIKKEQLKKHLDKLLPLEPENVTCIFTALCAFSSLFPETAQRLLVVHIGEIEVACVLVENGKLLKAHAFERSKDFQTEIKKTVLSFSPKAFESIYLLGSDDPLFIEEVKKGTGETPHYPTIPALHLSQERLIKFGLVIGIAIAAQTINFRKKEFAYPHAFKRLKKPFTLFLSFCFTLAISLFGLTKMALRHQELRVCHAYQTLLASCPRQDPNMPKTAAEYGIELQKIEKEILSKPDTFPLLPGVPKVRETLAFLTQQVKSITIKNFRYQMVKRPHFSQKNEKYRVRVDLEFEAEDAQAARQLHELLVAPNGIVDPKSEVTWESSKGFYKTSFFLKDKTRYHG